MDPAQMANEAVRRLQATSTSTGTSEFRDGNDVLVDLFDQLAALDGWAKIARDRVLADPADERGASELRSSCEQAARLHPAFNRRLGDALHDRAAVKTDRSVPPLPAPKGAALLG